MSSNDHCEVAGGTMVQPFFCERSGSLYVGDTSTLLKDRAISREYSGKCDLVFFSPPYSLVKQKSYRNKKDAEYVEWLSSYAKPLVKLLKPTGSIVIELGNAWNQGSPTMSTTPVESLLAFKASGNLHLCQEFIWHNPARLPSPAQWVTVDRIRVKDSFTRIWWLAPSEKPKADNRRVLQPYSKSMKQLLKTRKYNSGMRPSEHHIGKESFLSDNGGAIPASAMSYDGPESFISVSNTRSTARADYAYREYCRLHGLPQHPARMPADLVKFFIEFLTEPGDVVVDPFAGSNTTGWVAHDLGRKWLSFELSEDYAKGSRARFIVDEDVSLPLVAGGNAA